MGNRLDEQIPGLMHWMKGSLFSLSSIRYTGRSVPSTALYAQTPYDAPSRGTWAPASAEGALRDHNIQSGRLRKCWGA